MSLVCQGSVEDTIHVIVTDVSEAVWKIGYMSLSLMCQDSVEDRIHVIVTDV